MKQKQWEQPLRAEEAQSENPWYQQAEQIWEALSSRAPFAYQPTGDALYRQYQNQYQAQGLQAMEDTLGRASALTGGYATSYGQTVGQQSYERYLQALNERVPELYAQARTAYDREGQALLQQLQQARAFYETDAEQQQNAQNHADAQSWKERDYAYDTAILMLQNGVMPSAALLSAAGISAADAAAMRSYFALLAAAKLH